MDKRGNPNDEEEEMGIAENENPNPSYKPASNFEGKGKFIKETVKEQNENMVKTNFFLEFFKF